MIAGVIGYRNHSARIINFIKKNSAIKKIIVFNYRKNFINLVDKKNRINFVNKLDQLNSCNLIFITSPSKTHVKYIKYFHNKYIFCEKTAGISKKDYLYLKALKKRNINKIYINYNILLSKLFIFLSNFIKNKKYGKIINLSINDCNGLAFKKNLINNWRFSSKSIFENISGNVGSHYVNLFLNLFCNIKNSKIFISSVKKNRDNAKIYLENNNSIKANYFLSYSSPLHFEISCFKTNGIFKFINNKILIYHPRDNFNNKGYFVKPKLNKVFNLNYEKDYLYSLKKSVDSFIYNSRNKKKFKNNDFDNAIDTLKFFL